MPEQKPMFDDPSPDLHQQIAELERELAMRREVYPGWIELGRIKEATANYRIRCLEAAIEQLKARKAMMPGGV